MVRLHLSIFLFFLLPNAFSQRLIRLRNLFSCSLALLATTLTALSIFFCPGAALAQPPDPTTNSSAVTPADVFIELQRVEQMIDRLSRHMGIREPEALDIKISNAAPHDVYFQVRTLAIRANRLSFERIRRDTPTPPLPDREIRPTELRLMVIEALRALHNVSMEFDLQITHPVLKVQKGITPSDVFMATMSVNRHLNALLERRFAPEEVYGVVNLGISYASNMLTDFPEAIHIPKKAPYEKDKRPLDVYYRLYTCLQLINQIYQAKGMEILEIDIGSIEQENITPSDVFDMASLVVARLDFLHKRSSSRRQPRESYFPGRKFPSDVFQQASILEQQLVSLLSFLTTQPKRETTPRSR